MLIIPFKGNLCVVTAVGVYGMNLEPASILAAVRYFVPFGRPARCYIVGPAGCQSSDFTAVNTHNEYLRFSEPI